MSRDKSDQAMAYLKAKMSVDGVATLNFPDGQMFMFSREMVQKLIASMDEKKADECLVFIARGAVPKELKDEVV